MSESHWKKAALDCSWQAIIQVLHMETGNTGRAQSTAPMEGGTSRVGAAV